MKTIQYKAHGSHCESCEKIITKQAQKIEGVKQASFNYQTEKGEIVFDDTKTDVKTILEAITNKGYKAEEIETKNHKDPKKKPFTYGWIFIVAGIILASFFIFRMVEGINLPTISPTMGYGLLFIVGLLTGFHCIAMCGGFVLSYTTKDAEAKRKPHTSHILYSSGKTISYVIIGAAMGLLGSIIAFTPTIRAVFGIAAGIFLIIFGIRMLDFVPFLRKFSIRTPGFISKVIGKNANASPLIIGLLNGLMLACGPLQALYIMAAGTGSFLEGAKMLLIFGLGTLPAMIGFAYFASYVTTKVTRTILKASGVIVIILGILMINNSLVLSGTGYDAKTPTTKTTVGDKGALQTNPGLYLAPNTQIAQQFSGYQEITMDVTAAGWSPDKFVLKQGVPVKWIINGKEITSCNSAIQVPKYNLKFGVKQGTQTIEFTPTTEGTVAWSCWMGMIRGTFIVLNEQQFNDPTQQTAQAQAAAQTATPIKSGGCGCQGNGGNMMAGGSCHG